MAYSGQASAPPGHGMAGQDLLQHREPLTDLCEVARAAAKLNIKENRLEQREVN
jgi:hypothetical protein